MLPATPRHRQRLNLLRPWRLTRIIWPVSWGSGGFVFYDLLLDLRFVHIVTGLCLDQIFCPQRRVRLQVLGLVAAEPADLGKHSDRYPCAHQAGLTTRNVRRALHTGKGTG